MEFQASADLSGVRLWFWQNALAVILPPGMAAEVGPLLEFIQAMEAQGASDEFVVALLQENEWSERRIYQAFSALYEARTGRAIPNGGGRIEAAKVLFSICSLS